MDQMKKHDKYLGHEAVKWRDSSVQCSAMKGQFHAPCVGDSRVENMVNVNGEELKESLFARSGDGIRGVVGVRPSVRAIGEASVRKEIEDAFVRIFFGSHEDEAARLRYRYMQENARLTAPACEGIQSHRRLMRRL